MKNGRTNRAPAVLKGFYKVLTVISTVSFILLTALICVQVFIRYVLKSPIYGIDQYEMFPIMWVYVIGGCMASYERDHIECGLFYLFIKDERKTRILNIVRDILTIALLIIVTVWDYKHFSYVLKLGKTTLYGSIPYAFCDCVLFIGLICMGLFAIRDLFEDIADSRASAAEEEAE